MRTTGRAGRWRWLLLGVACGSGVAGCEGLLSTGALADRPAEDAGSPDATTITDAPPEERTTDTAADVPPVVTDSPVDAPAEAPVACSGSVCSIGGRSGTCVNGSCLPLNNGPCLPVSDGSCLPVSSSAATELGLWLTADRGLTCDANNIGTGWADQSGHGDDATTTCNASLPDGGTVGVHTGPACAAPGHVINDIPVPYFAGSDGPPYVSGTFDVNLGFLTGSPFTVFLVERRWSGMRANFAPNLALGTEFPTDPPGSSPPPLSTLQVGYVAYNSGLGGVHCPQLSLDLGNWGSQNAVPPDDAGTAAPLSIDTFRMGPTTGLTVWINGHIQSATNSYQTLSGAYASSQALGSIGRGAWVNFRDERFNGDIAEVLVFATSLSEADRQGIEGYLEMRWGPVTELTNGGGCP
jgi:hypothetical protein